MNLFVESTTCEPASSSWWNGANVTSLERRTPLFCTPIAVHANANWREVYITHNNKWLCFHMEQWHDTLTAISVLTCHGFLTHFAYCVCVAQNKIQDTSRFAICLPNLEMHFLYSTYLPMIYYPPTTFFGQKLCGRVFIYIVSAHTLYRGTASCTGNDDSRQVTNFHM